MKSILDFIGANHERYLTELKELLSIPSVSSKNERKPEIQHAAEWLKNHLITIGMQSVQIMETRGNPVLYAEWLNAAGMPTVLIYGHYDVQPEEPIDEWTTPPFEAIIRDGNLFARGASDDKGQLFIHLKAIEAFLKNDGKLPINIKIIFEGEEEIGSENLGSFIQSHKDLLRCDLILISDTSMFAKGVPSITYSLRGLSYVEVEVIGPNTDLHSGSFGGSIHNPIQALAEMIASLHDKNGRVTIKGFYDDVRWPTKGERAALKRLPWKDRDYANKLGLKQLYGEKGFTSLERLWIRPTLECNGIWGGYTGEGAKTVLPSKAFAKISMRLVPNQKSEKIAKLFKKHFVAITPKTIQVKVKILSGGEPAITPIDSAGVLTAVAALEKGFGKKPLYQGEGGSIPIVVDFKKMLGVDSVLLGFGLPDENAHAPNEFMSLDNFFGGIRTCAYYYAELPKYWGKKK